MSFPAPQMGYHIYQTIKYRNDNQGQNSRYYQTTNHYRGQRTLYLGSGRSSYGHRHKAQRSDQSGQEDRSQQMRTSFCYNSVRTHGICFFFSQIIKMVNHQNTVQHGYTKQGDESYTGGNTERESAQPQSYHTTNQ